MDSLLSPALAGSTASPIRSTDQVIDFETFFDSANGYTLKKMSILEYVKSPLFKIHGVAVSPVGGKSEWIGGHKRVMEWAKSIDWRDIIVIAHNAKFDAAIMAWALGVKPKGYICTQAMARAVLGYRVSSHSLETVGKHFGLEPKGVMRTDGIRDLTPEQEAELAAYAKIDSDICRGSLIEMAKTFPVSQYPVMDWTIRCFVEPKLELDAPTLRTVNTTEKERRTKIFQEIGIPKAVFSSNDKFSELLTSKGYEVPMKKSPRTGNLIPAFAVSDIGFQEMWDSDDKQLSDLCEARVAAKSNLLETRSEKFLRLSAFGAFPFDLNFSGAKQTHRFSGGGGAGGNPQNLTRGSALRKAVKAPAGHKLLVADFAAIEARIVAWLAREPKLMAEFMKEKADPYSAFATRIYGRQITKENKAERQLGKESILGLGYNMGPKKFALNVKSKTGIDLSEERSEEIVELYRMYYSAIPKLWKMLDHYIPYIASGATVGLPGIPFLKIQKGCVVLPSGLPLQYPKLHVDIETDEWIYEVHKREGRQWAKLYGGKLLENISQALAGEICKLAISRAEAAGLWCAGQVHDEVIAVVKEEGAQAGAAILKKAMEDPIRWWPSLKMTAEVGIGDNWLDAKGA